MLKESILITGATGCLGSNLVRFLLARGERVIVFKRHGEPLGALSGSRRSFETRFGDIRDFGSVKKAMAGVSQVYHLAGVVVPLNQYEREMWEVNVVGTFNVLRAASECGATRVVHVSSTAAIGYPPDGVVADEAFPFVDSVESNSYSITKRRGEEIALGFNSELLQVVAVNPSAVIAPGGSRRYGWAALIDALRRGRVRVCPIGGSAFCTGHDLVDGLVKAMQAGTPGQRYILSSANLSYAELTRDLARIMSMASPKVRGGKWFFDTVGTMNDWAARIVNDPSRSPILVSENTALISRMLFYNQAKAVRELELSQTSVHEALLDLCNWCRTETDYAIA